MDNEQRIKRLEEEVSWLRHDIVNLINIIENVESENHTHFTFITDNRPCTDCKVEKDTKLEDFI